MKHLVILLIILLNFSSFAEDDHIVLTIGKEQTVSDLLWQNGITNLYDKDGKIGNLRKVLFYNRLSFDKAKKLPEGFKIVIPRELNKYFITNKELLNNELSEKK